MSIDRPDSGGKDVRTVVHRVVGLERQVQTLDRGLRDMELRLQTAELTKADKEWLSTQFNQLENQVLALAQAVQGIKDTSVTQLDLERAKARLDAVASTTERLEARMAQIDGGAATTGRFHLTEDQKSKLTLAGAAGGGGGVLYVLQQLIEWLGKAG